MFKHVYEKRELHYLRITLKTNSVRCSKNAEEKEKRN